MGTEPAPPLLTFGHGTATQDEILALLREAGVAAVVDVRRFPGSRRHPHVARDELSRWLRAAGIEYRWEERLGGRRSRRADSPHTGLRQPAFQAYADHMDSPEFHDALDEALADARNRRVAVMCSESVWWRCHRRLISDAVTLLADRDVLHLMHDGRLTTHIPTDVAAVVDGRLRYDGSA